jgi:hypothetical protein
MGYTCSVCGAYHDDEVRDIRMTLPEPVFRLDERERAERAWVGEDSSVLRDDGGERYFVRGLLELPLRNADDRFAYGVWVEVGEDDFSALDKLWRDPDGHLHAPFAGRLANELTPYRGTVGLPVGLRLRDVRVLPLVELETGDHPLVRDQLAGISDHHAHELGAAVP